MNEEPTKELPDRGSFEQRVFARFDAIDARFDGVDVRFDGVDARLDGVDARLDRVDARLEKLESHSSNTKPIWERALKEILETQLEVGGLKSKVEAIETKVEQLVESQRDFKIKLTRRIDLVLETLVDTREGMRDADERLTRLESKLA